MLIQNLTTSQNKDTSSVLDFSADIVEVRIVNTELTSFPIGSLQEGKVSEQGTSGTNQGQVQAAPVPDNASFLSTASSALGF